MVNIYIVSFLIMVIIPSKIILHHIISLIVVKFENPGQYCCTRLIRNSKQYGESRSLEVSRMPTSPNLED